MYRIQGTIKQVSFKGKIFGIICGDNELDYFFIPSSMAAPPQFWLLDTGRRVEFEPTRTIHGLRALIVTVLSQRGTDRGEGTLHAEQS